MKKLTKLASPEYYYGGKVTIIYEHKDSVCVHREVDDKILVVKKNKLRLKDSVKVWKVHNNIILEQGEHRITIYQREIGRVLDEINCYFITIAH